jgi:hypothetical protein
MFDAVNAIEKKYAPFKVTMIVPKGASVETAAAAAARRVLVELLPQERDSIEAAFRASVANIPDGEAKSNGAALGEDVAVKMVSWRADGVRRSRRDPPRNWRYDFRLWFF